MKIASRLLNIRNGPLKDFAISLGITYLACSMFMLIATKTMEPFIGVLLLILLITVVPLFAPQSFWPHTISIIVLLGAVIMVLRLPIPSLFKIAALLILYCLWFYFDFPFFAGAWSA